MKAGFVRRIALYGALACTLPLWSPRTLALDPALEVAQYAHAAWRSREGFPRGTVTSIAQTTDGYLWLGTNFGLMRFDGVRAERWQPPPGEHLPSNWVNALLAARDGTLWIGTDNGLAAWRSGKLTAYPDLADHRIFALLEDREGTVWIGGGSRSGLSAKLCAFRSASIKCYEGDRSLGRWVGALLEDSKGTLWVETSGGVWHWQPGPARFFSLVPISFQMAESADGALLVATQAGIERISADKVETVRFAQIPPRAPARSLFRDRDGAVWIGTHERGLLHVHGSRSDSFSTSEGLSGDDVFRLFEDREATIWVATSNGLDRFREFAAPTLSARQGLSNFALTVLGSRDGGVWISTASGLNRCDQGRITVYRSRHDPSQPQSSRAAATPAPVSEVVVSGLPDGAASLYEDRSGRLWIGSHSSLGYLRNGRFVPIRNVASGYIDAITEDDQGRIWIAHRDLGLIRLADDRAVEQTDWAKLSARGSAFRLARDPSRGGLWLGFALGGVARVVDGRVRESYGAADGLGQGWVYDIHVDADATVWVATEGGLSTLRNGRLATLTSANGLPCDKVDTIMEGVDAYWLYMACGLVRVARSDLRAWTAASDHRQGGPIQTSVLDDSDGVRFAPLLGSFSPHATAARDGKIWLVAYDGVTVVDPRRLHANPLPPPVQIKQITADHKSYEVDIDPKQSLRLPSLIRDLSIDYTALSLVAPEKVHFRFRLEGQDSTWREVVNDRHVEYSNLAPGSYRFRVAASNNSGVWNEQGASLDFSITPAYWQTNWFRALCGVVLAALLWAAYQLRVRRLSRQFSLTLDARVEERTRIARELHDTLLQSFQALLLRFQAISNRQTGQVKQELDSAIEQAAEAIAEGRDAVQGLRASAVESGDLAQALKTAAEELAANRSSSSSAALTVIVEGAPRTLHPVVQDEIYRIGCEALRNAFVHAGATRIDVELGYDERQLRLRVRDDGKGIDPKFRGEEGRAGHFGLHGMRERARLIGGKLSVWSGVDFGTEVELLVPAASAYAGSASKHHGWFTRRLYGKIRWIDR